MFDGIVRQFLFSSIYFLMKKLFDWKNYLCLMHGWGVACDRVESVESVECSTV